MSVNTQFVTQAGDFIYWTIPVSNTSLVTEPAAIVTTTIPAGLVVTSFSTTKGTYNTGTGVWTIGSLSPSEQRQLVVVLKVTDISLAPYTLTAVVSGTLLDPNALNNTLTDTVAATTCPPTAGAVDDGFSCLCGTVASNDTPCTHCTTRYELDLTSFDNVVMNNWETATGAYSVSLIDPNTVGTFQYTIWCDCTSGPLETSGPATVTVQPLFTTPINVPAPASTDPCCGGGSATVTTSAITIDSVSVGASDNILRISGMTLPGGLTSATINWGDGNVDALTGSVIAPAVLEHTYAADGDYVVEVSGITPQGNLIYLKWYLTVDTATLEDAQATAIPAPASPTAVAPAIALNFANCPAILGDVEVTWENPGMGAQIIDFQVGTNTLSGSAADSNPYQDDFFGQWLTGASTQIVTGKVYEDAGGSRGAVISEFGFQVVVAC